MREIFGLPSANSSMAELVGDLIAKCVIDLHPAVLNRPLELHD